MSENQTESGSINHRVCILTGNGINKKKRKKERKKK